MLYEKVLELCNGAPKRYLRGKVFVYRLMMKQKEHAEKLLEDTKKFTP